MFQLSNLYTGSVTQIPSHLTVNHLYYAYDTKELYGFNFDGTPILIVGNDTNIQIEDVIGLEGYLISHDIAISGLTSSAITANTNINNLTLSAITANTQITNLTSSAVTANSQILNIYDLLLRKQNIPTGFVSGLTLNINPFDNTKFDISPGLYVVSNFDNPLAANVTGILYPGMTGITPTYLTVSGINASYIALDVNQSIIQSASPFENADRRSLALIGAVIHSNNININVVNEIKAPVVGPTNQLHDFIKAIGSLNLNGNIYGPNGTNMMLNRSSGQIWGLGINAHDNMDPHRLTLSGQTGFTFNYRLRTGTQFANTTVINPDQYDLNSVLTTVSNNKFTIQRINLFQSGITRIQYGQTQYDTMNDAKTLMATETFVTEQNIAENAIFRAFLIIKKGVTNLTSAVATNDALFVPVDKFGNALGSPGVTLNFAAIVAALGYTPENVSNKQNSLTIDGTGTKYPTVDAVNLAFTNLSGYTGLDVRYYTETETDTLLANKANIITYKNITGSTTLDSSYNNSIVRILTTCNITVPSGLTSGFNCVFDSIGTVTGTFIADVGVTISAPFGLKLANNSMCSLYFTSTNNYRLNGGLST